MFKLTKCGKYSDCPYLLPAYYYYYYYAIKRNLLKVKEISLFFCKNYAILFIAVLSIYTRVPDERQTTDKIL